MAKIAKGGAIDLIALIALIGLIALRSGGRGGGGGGGIFRDAGFQRLGSHTLILVIDVSV